MIFEFEDYAPVNGQGVSSFNGDQRPCRDPWRAYRAQRVIEGAEACPPSTGGGKAVVTCS